MPVRARIPLEELPWRRSRRLHCNVADISSLSAAYLALVNSARIQKGETVLIHWAAGGLGQAAIQLAQVIGCEIYATVGSIQKRDILENSYGIPRDHIFSSRDLSFADGIKRMTKGRGVDVILNSTSGDALKASWECIAQYGRFIEVGKYDTMTNMRLPMAPFMKNATFSFMDLIHVNLFNPEIGSEVFDKVMALMGEGKLKAPVPVQVYNYSQLEEAFRFMQSGRHSGKIVFEARDEDLVKVSSEHNHLVYIRVAHPILGSEVSQATVQLQTRRNLCPFRRPWRRRPKYCAMVSPPPILGYRVSELVAQN